MYDEAVDECSDDWTVWSVVYEEDTMKKKSLVWNYFSSTSSKEAECNACSKTVKVGRGTSNLRAHLKKWHKSDYDQLKNSSKSKSGKPAKTEVVDGPQGEYQEDTVKKKSLVWIFFSSTSSKEAECNLCSRTVKVAGGTSNLRAHLKKWHISAFARLKNSSKLKSDKPAKTEVVDGPQGEYQEDKGKKKSLAWNFFSSTSSKEAECKVCSRTVKVAGGTSNLRAHLRKWHISAFALLNNSSKLKSDKPAKTQVVDDPHLGEPESGELEPSKSKGVKRQTAVTEAHDRVKSFKPSGTRDAAITDAILYMVCKDGLPLSATDHEGLKFLLKTIAPLYEVPGREKLTNLLEVKHSSLRGVAEQQLTQAVWVSITADLASVTAKGCLVVTGHYIDRGRSQTVCLGVSELTPGHTGDHIANDLSRVLHSWNLETKKVCSITTDDGANIIAAVRKLMGGELNHVPCTAHLLNLCVWRALARTDLKTAVIEKVKLIVSYFCRSISASDAVRAAQRQKGVLVPLELIRGVETRWTGTFYSLERFAQLAGCVSQVLLSADHGTAPPMLSSEELAVVNDLVTVLRPFEKATKELSGDKYVTASIVLPIVNYLRRAVTKASLVSEDAAPLNEALLEQIDQQLVPLEANYLLASATVLDPRFKLIHFQLPVNSTNTLQRLSQEIRALGGAPEASSSTQQSATAEDVSDESLWDLHDQLASAVEIPSSSTELHPELKLYLSLATVARTECPLKFWSDQDKTFPTLARLAEKYLTVMGSSVASERIVSRLNAAASDSRERLAPAHVNMLVFMSSLERDAWFSQ